MSEVNYFLLCKKKCYKMYLMMNNLVESLEIINNDHYGDFSVIEAKEYAQQFKENSERFQKIAQQICCHTFVDDHIDISPERSQNIRYCTICEYTDC